MFLLKLIYFLHLRYDDNDDDDDIVWSYFSLRSATRKKRHSDMPTAVWCKQLPVYFELEKNIFNS